MAIISSEVKPADTTARAWYSLSAEEAAAKLGVDPAAGLSADRTAGLLARNGPNALPEEKAKPGWRRFLDEYRTFMQIILVAAGVVSLLVKEWGTAVVLFVLTVLNAVIGLREEGKAESAMNALKSMMKATARVRRDGAEVGRLSRLGTARQALGVSEWQGTGAATRRL